MKLFVCAVFDQAVRAYMQPFFQRSEDEAVRTFTQAVRDKDSPFSKFPEQFTLMSLGSWDDNSGELQSWATGARPIVAAVQLVGQ